MNLNNDKIKATVVLTAKDNKGKKFSFDFPYVGNKNVFLQSFKIASRKLDKEADKLLAEEE
jgi:hypothetical protein